MMTTSEQGISLIKKFEGFSAEAYLCPAGKMTIGYGHIICPGEKFSGPISKYEAGIILKNDIKISEQAVGRLVEVPIEQHQFDALVSFAFNLGQKSLENSTLLRLINNLEFLVASKQFGRWVYANGKKLDGLVRRRQAEADLFMGKQVI